MVVAHATHFDARCAKATIPGAPPLDLTELHDFAVEVALQAGLIIRRAARRQYVDARRSSASASTSTAKATPKASEIDLVTELDVQVEDFIRAQIEQRWPGHEIVAEESFGKNVGVKSNWQRGRGPRWHVDPLDGTMNFTHALQIHCVSVGFSCSHTDNEGALIEDDALVGAVYAPMLGAMGTLWSGARGHGSYLSYPHSFPTVGGQIVDHGCSLSLLKRAVQSVDVDDKGVGLQPLPPQQLPIANAPLSKNAPSGVLFASEWGKDRRSKRDDNGQRGNLTNKTETFINLAANDAFVDLQAENCPVRYVHGFRSIGSSALDLAFVAQGSIDVLWEGGCWEWDVCAGIAILLEAGGMVTDSNPPSRESSVYWKTGRRLPRAELGARRFLAIRGCSADSEESAVEAQERVAREIWKRTEGLNYKRAGVVYEVDRAEDEKSIDSTEQSPPSARDKVDPLRERKRLTKEEAEAIGADQVRGQGPDTDASDTFGGRLLDESQDQWSQNAWDHVDPPASYYALIEEKLKRQEDSKVTSEQAAEYHAKPAAYWDSFYQSHENRFFKDRKWLHLEFPELIGASLADAPHTRILEVGCGAGNTVFPLLEINRNAELEIFACDYSAEAVNVVKSNPLYSDTPCGTCQASVWDVTSTGADGGPCLPEGIEPHSLDIIVTIFVLSALHPDEWSRAIANIKYLLKKDGIVLARDYGRYDLPQLRFGKGRMLDDNFYVRGDGTRVYFFEPEQFLTLFDSSPLPTSEATCAASNGAVEKAYAFETLQLTMDRRMLLNRKERKQMYRNWLQAKFRKL